VVGDVAGRVLVFQRRGFIAMGTAELIPEQEYQHERQRTMGFIPTARKRDHQDVGPVPAHIAHNIMGG